MMNAMLAMGRLHILRPVVRRFAIACSYGTKAGGSKEYDMGSIQKGRYFLITYMQRRLPSQKSKRIPFDSNGINLSDVETNFQSCQSCVEVFKGILDQGQPLTPQEMQALDAIQMKIWDFHILDLDLEELFDLIERGVFKMYASDHLIRALFMRATAKFDTYDWDSKSITRLMCTAIVFRQVPRTLMQRVHTFVCLNMKLFSMKELTVIMNAFYVGKFNYGDVDFLASTVIDRALKNLGSLDSGELFVIIKACQSRRVNNTPFLFDVAEEFMKDEEVLKKHCKNFIDVAYLLKQYAKFRLDIPKFVTAVLRVMPKPIVDHATRHKDCSIELKSKRGRLLIRSKDIGTISWALGSMAYDVEDTTGVHSDLEDLFIAICSKHDQINHVNARDFFFGQVVAGRFTPTFIQYMREHSSRHLTEQYENSGYNDLKSRGMLAIFLRVSMDIECPEVELKKIPRGIMELSMKKDIAVSMSRHLEEVTNYMNEMLGGRFLVCHTVLPYITLSIEIRLDENNTPVSFTPTKYEDLLDEMENKELMLNRGRRIMVLIANKWSCLRSGVDRQTHDRPAGLTLVSQRHLHQLGYEYCLITAPPSHVSKKGVHVLTKLVQDFGVQLDPAVCQKYRIFPTSM